MVKTVITTPVGERTTSYITAVIRDQNGDPIPGGSLNSLTLTLYNVDASNTIINSVDDVNILNVGRGVVDANGNVTIELLLLDNQLVDTAKSFETHRALIEWTWGNTRQGRHEVEFLVQNMTRVP